MKYIARLWENMLARRTLSMVLCLTLAVTSASVCAASTNQLVQETRAAGEKENEPESREAERTKKRKVWHTIQFRIRPVRWKGNL